LPADGRADDRRRRADRRHGYHAAEDRRLLRGRGRRRRRLADLAHRALHDGLPRPRGRRPDHRHVPPDLRARRKHQGRLVRDPRERGLSATLMPVPADGRAAELRRRISYLMLYRVVLITLVLGVTVALNVASPQSLGTAQLLLFAINVTTYG